MLTVVVEPSHALDVLALLANSDDRACRPIFFRTIFRADASGPESKVVVVFLDGRQIRRDFQLIGRTKAAKCARRQFPNQTLLVWHLLLPVVVGEDLHDGAVGVEEGAVRNL